MHICVMYIALDCKLKLVAELCEMSESTGTCSIDDHCDKV